MFKLKFSNKNVKSSDFKDWFEVYRLEPETKAFILRNGGKEIKEPNRIYINKYGYPVYVDDNNEFHIMEFDYITEDNDYLALIDYVFYSENGRKRKVYNYWQKPYEELWEGFDESSWRMQKEFEEEFTEKALKSLEGIKREGFGSILTKVRNTVEDVYKKESDKWKLK